MSKPRYKWWGYVKWVIRDYPAKCEELNSMRTQNTTTSFDPQPHGTSVNRTTENVATREFTGQKQKEYEAVRSAIQETDRERMRMVDAVFLSKTHTLAGAAMLCHVSEITAVRWHGDFVRLVAKNMGLLD